MNGLTSYHLARERQREAHSQAVEARYVRAARTARRAQRAVATATRAAERLGSARG